MNTNEAIAEVAIEAQEEVKTGVSTKILVSTIIGNGMEWFDYLLYAHFATVISALFFPASSAHNSLMLTLAVFAAGFLSRPLGSYLFGIIGDRMGRKVALSASILLMALPTAIIGLLPTYAQIGIAAPLLILLMRLLQGVSVGGEFSCSTTYLYESAPKGRLAFFSSFSMMSLALGVLVSSASVLAIEAIFTKEEVLDYAWRIPFVGSILFGFLGFYIRSKLSESKEFLEAKKTDELQKRPFLEIAKHYKKNLLLVCGVFMTLTIPFYVIVIFSKTMMIMAGFPPKTATLYNIILVGVYMFFAPVSGFLADKIGERKILISACIATLLFALPFLMALESGDAHFVISAIVIAGALIGLYQGAIPSFSARNFPFEVRSSGVSLSYNLPVMIFGGVAPMIVTAIIAFSGGSILPVALYLAFGCICSLSSLFFIKLK